MRKFIVAATAVALAAGLGSTAPASATEVCDPVIPRGVCVYVRDARGACPPGYQRIGPRVPDPTTGGSLLLVCVLQ